MAAVIEKQPFFSKKIMIFAVGQIILFNLCNIGLSRYILYGRVGAEGAV